MRPTLSKSRPGGLVPPGLPATKRSRLNWYFPSKSDTIKAMDRKTDTISTSTCQLTAEQVEAARARRLEAMQLQEIEQNPLDAEDIAMFEMFERERWSHERRRAYILEQARQYSAPQAAE